MRRFYNALILFSLLLTTPAWAWWGGGHDILTQASVKALPEEMPEFFRNAEKMVAHCAYDPDISKERGTPHARQAEYGEHYIDIELFGEHPIPEGRDAHLKLCAELGLEPRKVGTLPYALAEWTERLAVAFAEYRKWPDNPMIQNKCFLYAGFLAHYAQDMCQPLHLTINFDGIKQPDGTRLHQGIHEKVDSAIEFLEFKPMDLARGQRIEAVDDLMPVIIKQIKTGHNLVDNVYALAEDWKNLKNPTPDLVEFTLIRARESVRWTASLYLTAWKLSEGIRLPGWLDRAKNDAE
jgi:hypothetical protein